MDIDDLIDQFVEDLTFEALVIWADILEVEHDENAWIKDIWIEKENELRLAVGEAMAKVGK